MDNCYESKLRLQHIVSLLMLIISVRFPLLAAKIRLHDYDTLNDSVCNADISSRIPLEDSAYNVHLSIVPTELRQELDPGLLSETDSGVTAKPRKSIYELPYSLNATSPNWRRLWLNTAILGGAFVSTLVVLECLPEDATSWNRAEIRSVPPFKRWFRNVFKKGPEWDHDKFYFNYLLHPYAGAVYYMGARSCGFNAWQSLLYCSIISTVFWEFGIEAFMERPSIQDIFITPLVGSLIGECFYRIKRKIVNDGYRLCNSPVLGNIVVFLVDPINEIIGLFAGNECRKLQTKPQISNLSSSFVFQSDFGLKLGLSMAFTF